MSLTSIVGSLGVVTLSPFGRLRRKRDLGPDVDTVRSLTPRWLTAWSRLSDDERERMVADTVELAGSLRWEPANGFAITDDMKVAIASHAALLTLGLPDGVASYRQVSSVIVHPSTIRRTGPRQAGGGLVTDRTTSLIGEAHHRGPVLVSWSSARHQSRHPRTGENVILHEFAHRLDMLDGLVDGTPVLPDEETTERWVEVCTAVYERLREGEDHPVLRDYAATDPGEFFAVATESFFVAPDALREHEPELYALFARYYGQDPASSTEMAASS